ncbi:MAG: TIGR02281 family clan AA aspartic protease [Gammaproteobacteria bacterium]|jgi:aspartyl protease family protein|nr:TIGR02281 family clan AA aspartic protease [Gammaproteobacteria bacterium]MBT4492579.1 TIGR02281 family clan AA aspartic protease [Gammaproteobacteria bacterium]MBT7370586.1 TIGR02281 family clan AA aspartic protease [Gammaproteobacteria bacterium]
MDSTRAGQGMMTIAVILGMAMLTWYFGGVEEKQRNPNADPQSLIHLNSVEVPLKRNRLGHYLVNGIINGREVEFLLDTGATDVVVPETTAKRLGLAYGRRGQAMTANGAVTVYQTRIDELQIGEIKLYNITASINPAMSSGAILLGMSALGQIEFSQQGNTLTLRQHSG